MLSPPAGQTFYVKEQTITCHRSVMLSDIVYGCFAISFEEWLRLKRFKTVEPEACYHCFTVVIDTRPLNMNARKPIMTFIEINAPLSLPKICGGKANSHQL